MFSHILFCDPSMQVIWTDAALVRHKLGVIVHMSAFFFFDQHLSGSIKPLENQNLIFTNVRLKLKMRTTARTK